MSSWKRDLIACYLEKGALAKGNFTLAGGGSSNFYIDGRLVTTSPNGLRAIVAGFRELTGHLKLFNTEETLVAPALSGIPIAAAMAVTCGIPFVMDRGAAKEHGRGRRFEGRFGPNPECIVVDDLVTVASTVASTIEGLQELGLYVRRVLVVVDREEGARARLDSMNVELHSLLTKSDLELAFRERSPNQ